MDESTIPDIAKIDQGFVSHVFNFDNKSKQDLLNIMQYSILAIIPVVLLNKTLQKVIPEADETKASLELLAEIVAQTGIIFIGIFFIHRIVTYFPTYSEAKYESFSVINCVVSFLIIILSLQTKLGEKMNIIADRLLLSMQSPQPTHSSTPASELSVPVIHQQQMHHNNNITPPQNEVDQFLQPQDHPILAANESIGGAFGSAF